MHYWMIVLVNPIALCPDHTTVPVADCVLNLDEKTFNGTFSTTIDKEQVAEAVSSDRIYVHTRVDGSASLLKLVCSTSVGSVTNSTLIHRCTIRHIIDCLRLVTEIHY